MASAFSRLVLSVATLAIAIPAPAMAAQKAPPARDVAGSTIDFGDDSSQFANDGECDDMRFDGAGLTNTLLLDSDILADATDCRSAHRQGRLTYLGGERNPAFNRIADIQRRNQSSDRDVDFGNDDGNYARDGECDDMRFAGPGMTNTPLLDADIRSDASDCRTAYNQNRITYLGAYRSGSEPVSDSSTQHGYADSGINHIMWGDNTGSKARNGKCDDMRFSGRGMSTGPLSANDVQKDAADCRAAFQRGDIQLRR